MTMKRRSILHSACATALAAIALVSCQTRWEGETVESSYRWTGLPDPTYKFVRNGRSSVDTYECALLAEPLEILYSSYLREARLSSEGTLTMAHSYLSDGLYGILRPADAVASSTLHRADRERILRDLSGAIDASAQLSGLGTPEPNVTRNHRVAPGEGGYIGAHIGDDFICFATAPGLVPAEYFRELVRGAIYLDLILNVHLSEGLYKEGDLRRRHERTELPDGHNYTDLEHHWDLAYGYYDLYWRPLIGVTNSPLLKESRIRLFNAFALGRWALTEYKYDLLEEQLTLIRQELSRVAAVRALQLLCGRITMVNYREDPKSAFYFISQGLGALYGLQFATDRTGHPLFSYTEVAGYIETLLAGEGLWDRERLLGTDEQPGDLPRLTREIADRCGLRLSEIK